MNQLVRTQRHQIKLLFSAGDSVQRAQSDLLAGRAGARAIRKAAQAEWVAAEEPTQAACKLLTEAGHVLTPARLGRVSETLLAKFEQAQRALERL